MRIKFDYVHNNRTIVVHAQIIDGCDSYIEEVTTKRGKMYPATRQLEIDLEVVALKKYLSGK